ncbi:hypothetical protein L6452_40842 [Arctium lappa]|uniref:Uncharacterized protein n=1 Tax=Arctium lappa TaxID=4217 RepID=A0ACB8XN80_ARCLA|nr:hypothetical protein L6452_40842 [Arctium lappa]
MIYRWLLKMEKDTNSSMSPSRSVAAGFQGNRTPIFFPYDLCGQDRVPPMSLLSPPNVEENAANKMAGLRVLCWPDICLTMLSKILDPNWGDICLNASHYLSTTAVASLEGWVATKGVGDAGPKN